MSDKSGSCTLVGKPAQTASHPSHRIHRHPKMDELGRNLWRWSSPTPLLKVESLQQVAQSCVQFGLNVTKGGNSVTSLGSLFQHSTTLKNFFSHV